jgi:hypothetical protein
MVIKLTLILIEFVEGTRIRPVEGTRIRPVDDAVVPIDVYVFNELTEFLGLSHQSEFMIGELLIELNNDQLNTLLCLGYFFLGECRMHIF